MNTSPTHVGAKKKRNTTRCSVCRHKKVKCEPQPRDWENTQQKCTYCEDHNEACGPNYKNKDDPEVIKRGSRDANIQEEVSTQGSVQYPVIEAAVNPPVADAFRPATRIEHERPHGRSSNAIQGKLPAFSVDELKEKALCNLDELNALGTTLKSIRLRTAPIHHRCRSDAEPSNVMFIKEKLHRSFISTYILGVQAYEQQSCDQARWILLALLSALERYQTLLDSQKRVPLLKIANIFQDLGHPWECEHILERMTRLDTPSTPAFSEDPCLRLAESLLKTSETVGSVLTTLWKDTVGDDDPPRHLMVPPLQRAAAISNAGVTSALLAHRNGVDPRPTKFDEHYLRVASYLGTPQIQPRLGIDDRDLHGRTALFVAASHGFDQCCLTLLSGLADPNSRDQRGHTVLEVATRGGHLEVVKLLIGVGASVNPQLSCCSSSPLQAVLEGDNPNKELVDHLLDQGASVSTPRPLDDRTALDIANWKGHTDLANAMRRRTPVQSPYPFGFGIQDFPGQNLGVQHLGNQEPRYDWP